MLHCLLLGVPAEPSGLSLEEKTNTLKMSLKYLNKQKPKIVLQFLGLNSYYYIWRNLVAHY
jgi:hypothetical protein